MKVLVLSMNLSSLVNHPNVRENSVALERDFDMIALKSDEFKLDKVKIKYQCFSCINPIWEAFLEGKYLNIYAKYIEYFYILNLLKHNFKNCFPIF